MIKANLKLRWLQKLMATGKDVGSAIGAVALGIIGGIIAAAIINALRPIRCPGCQNTIQRGIQRCPTCGIFLQWGD